MNAKEWINTKGSELIRYLAVKSRMQGQKTLRLLNATESTQKPLTVGEYDKRVQESVRASFKWEACGWCKCGFIGSESDHKRRHNE